MITIICGKPRVGKTALNNHFALNSLNRSGTLRQRRCIEEINSINAARTGNKLVLPEIPPIYTNFEAKYKIGYKKKISPLWVNPFYLGLPNDDMPIQPIMPYGELHITEGQRYWDSRESASLPDHVSRWFETHGHFFIDIYIDVQRAKLIDKNIRALAKKIIEVQSMTQVVDEYGRIKRTIWICREFASSASYEAYEESGRPEYRTTRYIHNGNIFESYNSRSCKGDFIPPENDNFLVLQQPENIDVKALPEEIKKFYSSKMPKEFRAATRKPTVKENSNGNGKGAG